MVNSFLHSRWSIGRTRCARQARAIKYSNDRYGNSRVALSQKGPVGVRRGGAPKESNYKKQVRTVLVWVSCTQGEHTYVRRTCLGVFIDSRMHGTQSFLFWFKSASRFRWAMRTLSETHFHMLMKKFLYNLVGRVCVCVCACARSVAMCCFGCMLNRCTLAFPLSCRPFSFLFWFTLPARWIFFVL